MLQTARTRLHLTASYASYPSWAAWKVHEHGASVASECGEDGVVRVPLRERVPPWRW